MSQVMSRVRSAVEVRAGWSEPDVSATPMVLAIAAVVTETGVTAAPVMMVVVAASVVAHRVRRRVRQHEATDQAEDD